MEGAQADPLDGMAAGLQFRGPSRTMSFDEYNRMMRGSSLQIQARDSIRFGETGLGARRWRADVPKCVRVLLFH